MNERKDNTVSNGLQTIHSGQALAAVEWVAMKEQAEMLVKTGFLPKDVNTPEKAVAIMLTGRELSLPPMVALNNIVVIQGKPTISPQLMLALINRSGQLDNLEVVTGPEGAIVTMKRKGRSPYVARFGPVEAKAMGLSGKDNYSKQPETMFKWRAVAMAARTVFPDVILGLHTPDEMGAQVSYGATAEQIVEDLPVARAVEHDFVEGEIVPAEESGDEPSTLKARVRELCGQMNRAGHQPPWKDATLTLFVKEWYQAQSLDAMPVRDLKKLVGDFEKKLAALQSEGAAERSLAGGRAKGAIDRAGAQEGAAS
jgi:hypothetical protein